MNTSFTVIDRNNNLSKKADAIVKFNHESKDYLIYSIDENEQNKQIFVSRLILNSEGKYFIENILPEEKAKLNNIVYNIIIMLPTDHKKGGEAKTLIDEFTKKYTTTLSIDIPVLQEQEYYNSCSVAITSNELVEGAIDFFKENLYIEKETISPLPTWSIPSPIEVTENNNSNETQTVNVMPSTEATTNNTISNNSPVAPNFVPNNSIVTPIPNVNVEVPITSKPLTPVQEETIPNPQMEKLAIVSDPNLVNATGIEPQNVQATNMQANVGKQNLNIPKAGYANTKYIIIGTVCLVLAIIVVVVAYLLIKNM